MVDVWAAPGNKSVLLLSNSCGGGAAPYIITAPRRAHLPVVWCNVHQYDSFSLYSFCFLCNVVLCCGVKPSGYTPSRLMEASERAASLFPRSLFFPPPPQTWWHTDTNSPGADPAVEKRTRWLVQSICCHKVCSNVVMRADFLRGCFHDERRDLEQTSRIMKYGGKEKYMLIWKFLPQVEMSVHWFSKDSRSTELPLCNKRL